MHAFTRFSLTIALAGMVTAVSGSAQTEKNQLQVFVMPLPAGAGCPIGLHAQHASGLTARIPVGKNGSPTEAQRVPERERGQHLQLTLMNLKGTVVSSIRITVHGWNGTSRTIPADRADYATASQTLELKVSVNPEGTADVDAWVAGLTSVNAIDLDEVSYADGLNWRASDAEPCRILPDPLMLISSNR